MAEEPEAEGSAAEGGERVDGDNSKRPPLRSNQISYQTWRKFYSRFKACIQMLIEVKDTWNKVEPSLIHGFQCGRSMSYMHSGPSSFSAPDVENLLQDHEPGTFVVWIGYELDTIVVSCLEDGTSTATTSPEGEQSSDRTEGGSRRGQ